MSTARSRIQKGRNFQSKMIDKLREVFNLSEDDVRAPIGSEKGPDAIFSEKALKKVRLCVESKNQKGMNILEAVEQVLYNTLQIKRKKKIDVDPIIFFHRSKGGNRRTWAIVDSNHYFELRKKLMEKENDHYFK